MICEIFYIKWIDKAGYRHCKSFDSERERYNFESQILYTGGEVLTKWSKRIIV